MDAIVYFIILCILIIFLLKYGEKIIFNLSESQKRKINQLNKNSEQFQSNLGMDITPQFSENFDFIYTTINGTYNILINNNLWNKTKYKNQNKPIFMGKLPFENKIKTGFYNYSNNELVLLDIKNSLYMFDIKEGIISDKIHAKYYFRNIKIKNIDCLFYLDGNIYLFDSGFVRIYDIKNEKLLLCSKTNKIFEELEGNKPLYIYLNYNDIEYKNPLPNIHIKCFGTTQIFRFKTFDSFEKIEESKYNISQSNSIIDTKIFEYGLKGELVEHIFKRSGNYRIITIGAGINGGGYGGMIFNDYYFNVDDRVSILVGQSGTRIPVKKSASSDISENLKNILPIKGGCSGSGGSFVFKNDEVIQASGGGGGWCSEIIRPPLISSSKCLFKNKENIDNKKNNLNAQSCAFFPIKKIVIESESTDIDDSYKIIIKNFDIETYSIDFIDINVSEYPLYDTLDLKKKNKAKQYETGYTSYGEKAYIEISFSETITDFKLFLDFEIKSYKNRFVNSKTHFYNEIGENIKQIHNLNLHEEFRMPLTPSKLISNEIYYTQESDSEYNGYSIKKINDLFKNQNQNQNKIKGGIGGGGSYYFNKYKNNLICGGGGGFNGGLGCVSNSNSNSNSNSKMNYVCGEGGESFVKTLNFPKKKWHLLNNSFVQNFNSKNGGVYIIEF